MLVPVRDAERHAVIEPVEARALAERVHRADQMQLAIAATLIEQRRRFGRVEAKCLLKRLRVVGEVKHLLRLHVGQKHLVSVGDGRGRVLIFRDAPLELRDDPRGAHRVVARSDARGRPLHVFHHVLVHPAAHRPHRVIRHVGHFCAVARRPGRGRDRTRLSALRSGP